MPSALSTVWLGVALLAGGALFDSPTLYVPGAALLLLAGSALTWVELSARGLRLHRAPGPATAIEGEEYPLRVSVQRGRVPLPGGELRDPALAASLPLGPSPPALIEAQVRLGRRGRRTLEPTTLLVRDPLRLHTHEVGSTGTTEVLVLPRVEPVLGAGAGGRDRGWRGADDGEDEAGERGRPRGAPAAEVDGLRPHQQGAPASRIHWPTVARTGELFDRQLTSGAESSHVVVLDVNRRSDEEALDRAVRAAASLCRRLAPDGGCALFLPGESRPLTVSQRLAGWPRLHARLALVTPTDGALAVRPSRRGLTIWISSGIEVPGRAELAALAARASHVVCPVEVPGLSAALTVAGCHGYSLRASAQGAPAAKAAVA